MRTASRDPWRRMQTRMDAAVPVDAQNAPTGTWKTAQHAVSHSAHTHHRCRERRRQKNAPHTKILTLPNESTHRLLSGRFPPPSLDYCFFVLFRLCHTPCPPSKICVPRSGFHACVPLLLVSTRARDRSRTAVFQRSLFVPFVRSRFSVPRSILRSLLNVPSFHS
jgi:hypothetical protein